MTAQIIPFKFKTNEVRTIEKQNLIWFVAIDIASILGYRDAEKMTRMLDEDEKDTHTMSTLGGEQETSIINESGLYHALLKSRKPEAKPFRKWVTAEVLPAIRKNGIYEAQKEVPKSTNPSLPLTLTPKQQHQVQCRVNDLAKLPGGSYAGVYRNIKNAFKVGSYKQVSQDQYPALCKMLAIKPLEGELMPAQQESLPEINLKDALFGGLSNPEAKLSPAMMQKLKQKAIGMAFEGYEVFEEYLLRRITHSCGPTMINENKAQAVLDGASLDAALTQRYHRSLTHALQTIEMAKEKMDECYESCLRAASSGLIGAEKTIN